MQTPVHHPATELFRESWSVLNPRGVEIHYPSKQEAIDAYTYGIW